MSNKIEDALKEKGYEVYKHADIGTNYFNERIRELEEYVLSGRIKGFTLIPETDVEGRYTAYRTYRFYIKE